MTEDVEGGCSILSASSQLAETLSEVSSTPISHYDGALFLNANMTVDRNCLYTSTDMAGSFPEGTVLQIVQGSSYLTVPSLNENSNLSGATIIFKDSSFSNELLEAENPTASNEFRNSTEISEANISDMDFLNNADDTTTKGLNGGGAAEELQRAVEQTLSSEGTVSRDNLECQSSEEPTNSTVPSDDVVMIDVSKPIQLCQNSLIMVNGQKCVLQHNLETGQVIAYPVKTQDKPRRKRGRPRKLSIDQAANSSMTAEQPTTENENVSDDGKEQGLLEIVNNDGSMVRRSTRKRKKAKVLRDYETGNLKQELGSDVDEVDLTETEQEAFSRRKKIRGPGRPRKYPPPQLTDTGQINAVSLVKRMRGRPKKESPSENEPTQAFLVQTADGQTLMMQVPLSSIPPGVSLQEVAQNIANRLNVGLTQNTISQSSSENAPQSLQPSDSTETNLNIAAEPAVQDHSIGSTTNFVSPEQFQCLDKTGSQLVSTGAADACATASDSNIDEVVIDENNYAKPPSNQAEKLLADCILSGQSQYSNLEEATQTAEANFCLNVSTSCSSLNSPLVETTEDPPLKDKQEGTELELNYSQFQVPKDFLSSGGFMKEKLNLQQLLENVVKATSMPGTNSAEVTNISSSNNNAGNAFEEDSEGAHQEESQSVVGNTEAEGNYDFLNSNLTPSTQDCSADKCATNTQSLISSIEHDHQFLVQNRPKEEAASPALVKTSLNKKVLPSVLSLENVLGITVMENVAMSSPSTTVVPVTSNEHLKLNKKLLPLIVPDPTEIIGSKKCKICLKAYLGDNELIEHFKKDHPKCICSHCDYMAEQAYVIKRHSIRHQENGIVCDICGKHYKDHYILKMHVKMIHTPAEVLFTCDICPKKFTRKAHLKRHLRTHEPNKPFKCSLCNYRGCEKSDITKHLLIHEDPKHKCQICGKAFRHIKNKELHLKRHFKQRDYKCGICDFYGYTFTDIRKHIERRHTDAKTSSCSECGLVFKNKEVLEEHRNSGTCEAASDEQRFTKPDLDELEEKEKSEVTDEMPLDMLEDDSEAHEESSSLEIDSPGSKTTTLHSNQLLLSAADGVLQNENGQLVISGLECSEFLSSENPSYLSVSDSESSKTVTLITVDGKSISWPVKEGENSSYVECILSTEKSNSVEALLLSEFEAST